LSRVKVIINKKGYIPSLGQGPIRRPVLITEELCKQLLALGYPVKVIAPQVKPVIKKEEEISPVIPSAEQKNTISAEQGKEATQVDETPADKKENATEEVVDNSTEEETVEEKEEEEEVIEILENDPDLSAGAFYTEDFLSSKNLCKKILSNREVQYAKDASFALLRELVLNSNPEVEEVSE